MPNPLASKKKTVPTCACGRTEFNVIETTLPISGEGAVMEVTLNRQFWLRICRYCSQVTWWSKKPVA